MKSRDKKLLSVFFTFSLALFLNFGLLSAGTPPAEKGSPKAAEGVKPPEPQKKSEKFVVKGREYCYECIDNSECLGCHGKQDQ